jgi:hypothetical protein
MADSKKKKPSKTKKKRMTKKQAGSVLEPPPMTTDEMRAAGVDEREFEVNISCPACQKDLDAGACPDCDEKGVLAGRVVITNPQERLAGLFGKAATDLELDLDAIGKATPGPWEVGFGYEQSDPGTFIAGNGVIVAAEQDDTDCVLRTEDAAFIARARDRFPILVDAAVELQFGFAELVRRYREWAAMGSCTPAVRELLRRISNDIENQLAPFDCERTGPSFVAMLGAEHEQLKGIKVAEEARKERDQFKSLPASLDEKIIAELRTDAEYWKGQYEERNEQHFQLRNRARAGSQAIIAELGSVGPEGVDQVIGRAVVALKARADRIATLEEQNAELQAKLQKKIVLVWRCPNCEAPCDVEGGQWFCSSDQCAASGDMPPEVVDAREDG